MIDIVSGVTSTKKDKDQKSQSNTASSQDFGLLLKKEIKKLKKGVDKQKKV